MCHNLADTYVGIILFLILKFWPLWTLLDRAGLHRFLGLDGAFLGFPVFDMVQKLPPPQSKHVKLINFDCLSRVQNSTNLVIQERRDEMFTSQTVFSSHSAGGVGGRFNNSCSASYQARQCSGCVRLNVCWASPNGATMTTPPTTPGSFPQLEATTVDLQRAMLKSQKPRNNTTLTPQGTAGIFRAKMGIRV